MELLQSPIFWVSVAFFVVVAIIVLKGRNAILGGAYARIERVSNEIAYAEGLREESQKLLVQYEKEYRENLEICKKIIEEAREETQNIIERITASSDDILSATTQRSKDAIERAKVDAVEEIRNQSIDKAMHIVSVVAQDLLTGQKSDDLITQATKDINSMVK